MDETFLIRRYAHKVGFKIIGDLKRRDDWEKQADEKWYEDDGHNEYGVIRGKGICIIDRFGGVW